MKVKVLQRSGNAAVVSWLDDKGIPQAAIISNHYTLGTRMGAQLDLPEDALQNGTEYGIDWLLVFPDEIITIDDLTKSLRNHGIWTEKDLLQKGSEAIAAINSCSAGIYMKMIDYAKRTLGE